MDVEDKDVQRYSRLIVMAEISSHRSVSNLSSKSLDEGNSINPAHKGNIFPPETWLKVQKQDNMAQLNIQGKPNEPSQSNPMSPGTRFNITPSDQHQNGADTMPTSHTSDNKTENDLSEEEVIETALSYPMKGREKITPRAFNERGDLVRKYHHLRPRIREQKSIRKIVERGRKIAGNAAGVKKRSKTKGKTRGLGQGDALVHHPMPVNATIGQEESDQGVQTDHPSPCAEHSTLGIANVESVKLGSRNPLGQPESVINVDDIPTPPPDRPSYPLANTVKNQAVVSLRERENGVSTSKPPLRLLVPKQRNPCHNCLKELCSCDPALGTLEKILPNRSHSGNEPLDQQNLENHDGDQLGEVQITPREHFQDLPAMETRSPEHAEVRFSRRTVSSKYGRDTLDDEDVRMAFEQLEGVILQYIAMARNKPSPIYTKGNILKISFIRDEVLDLDISAHNPLAHELRVMLEVPSGVRIKDKVENLNELLDLQTENWIRILLGFMFFNFIFRSDPLFEDSSIWHQSLTHSFSFEVPDIIIQDARLRTMQDDPYNPSSFATDMMAIREKCAKTLNSAMLPLVGADLETHGFHLKIARIAVDLNAKFAAYTGIFEEIRPMSGDLFVRKSHVLEDGSEPSLRSDRFISITLMAGVRFRLPGEEWRICLPAKVKLWPSPDEGIVPRKRVFGEVE